MLFFFFSSCSPGDEEPVDVWSSYKLWYAQPANEWNEALPVGNGRLGAMVFGGTAKETLQLNEETLWTGGPYDPSREGGAEALPKIQELVFAGEFAKAHDLFGRTMMGIPYEQQKYQPLGNLKLDFPGHEDVQNYRRELNLDSAVAKVTYEVDDVIYERSVFSSYPDDVIVVRISASEPESISFSAVLEGVRNSSHSNYDDAYFQMDAVEPDLLTLNGKNASYLGIEGKLNYQALVKVLPVGGVVTTNYRTVEVKDADAVTLLISGATSFVNYRDVSGNAKKRAADPLENAGLLSYNQLLAKHVEDYQELFRQCLFDIGDVKSASQPTDQRIIDYQPGQDDHLAALYFQYGRYLILSSSRQGTQPTNLQGIWNKDSNPWWDSKYTVNINLPMNYWPVEVANLEECFQPLEALVRDVSETGRAVARKHYGADGWVLHQNTDIWRAAAPMDGPSWGAWPVGGAWLCTHLWEHFSFSGDTAYLESVYPIIRDQVKFQLDFLVEHPDTTLLVTNPSNSPENFPAWEGNERFFDETTGISLKARTMSYAPTMDNMILRELFAQYIQASEILDVDSKLRDAALDASILLPVTKEGADGTLQEWIEDWGEVEPEHRHLSHLWGVFPGKEILPGDPQSLDTAAMNTLNSRGVGGCGWSMGHRMAAWARLRDGGKAMDEFTYLIQSASNPNLFCNCFRALQIDGNLGTTAGLAEMVLQSHNGHLRFMPAVPSSWNRGDIRGLRARGGFEVDISWESGKADVLIASKNGNPVVFPYSGEFSIYEGNKGIQPLILLDGMYSFATERGKEYRIELR